MVTIIVIRESGDYALGRVYTVPASEARRLRNAGIALIKRSDGPQSDKMQRGPLCDKAV